MGLGAALGRGSDNGGSNLAVGVCAIGVEGPLCLSTFSQVLHSHGVFTI
jgi:hypothetical protein